MTSLTCGDYPYLTYKKKYFQKWLLFWLTFSDLNIKDRYPNHKFVSFCTDFSRFSCICDLTFGPIFALEYWKKVFAITLLALVDWSRGHMLVKVCVGHLHIVTYMCTSVPDQNKQLVEFYKSSILKLFNLAG